ncbi:MAG: hypothetical protein K2J87_07660, partial [Muribaculaceae bacterium]|nr:hypothetical protein [Muribaculaceae bacterium]
MKHRKNLRSIASCVAAGVVLLAMTGCDNDDKVVNEDFEIINPGDASGEEMVEVVDLPAAIIGNPGDAGGELAKCFTNIVAPENARVILIESGMIAENEELLSAAFSKGNLIVVLNPESGTVEEWSERNNVFYAGPEADEKCAAYGFNNRGAYYSLHNRDLIDDDDVPLFYLCKWINIVAGNRLTGSDLRSKDIKKRFSSQSMTHTFKIKLDEKELVDGHWTSADQLQLTTTANVAYTIYPFFAFDGSAPGEYYAVEAEVTLHNAPLNNGSWVRRRGEELTQICGFYLNRCDLSANLLRKSDGKIAESGSHSFADGANPHPESMSDASSYDSGFAWNLDATLSGGLPDSKDNHKM